MTRSSSTLLVYLLALLVSVGVLGVLSVASVRYAPSWSATRERPMFVRMYRHHKGLIDFPREGFEPALDAFGEFIDADNGRTVCWSDPGSNKAQAELSTDSAFTGRYAMVFEQRASLGIWFESVRLKHWRIEVSDLSTNATKIGTRDEPVLASALRAVPPQDLPRPGWSVTAWFSLDLLGLLFAGACCWSIVGTVRHLARQSPRSVACASCG